MTNHHPIGRGINLYFLFLITGASDLSRSGESFAYSNPGFTPDNDTKAKGDSTPSPTTEEMKEIKRISQVPFEEITLGSSTYLNKV